MNSLAEALKNATFEKRIRPVFDAQIHVAITKEMEDKIKKAAHEEGITVPQFVRQILEKEVNDYAK